MKNAFQSIHHYEATISVQYLCHAISENLNNVTYKGL